jgi:hypothetical protein
MLANILTLDPGGDTNNVIIGKVKEPMVQEESFAADAEPPMDILPNREDIDCVLPNQVINQTLAAVEISPAVHGLTLSEHLARHYAKSMVNMMDRNTIDSTSGKCGTIYEVSSYSSASDTCSIQHNAQVNAFSSAIVVYQPNNGLVNNDLEVVEIVDTYCHVKVAHTDGQRLRLSVMTGMHVHFDPTIVIACINDLIDQGSTNHTVCRHKAFDYCIYDRGKISCSVSQSVMSKVTNVMWDLTPQLVHTFLTKWDTDLQWSQVKRFSLCSNSFQMCSMKTVSFSFYFSSC